MTVQADIAIIGVGVMGSNLALNMAENGFIVALYDLDPEKARALADNNFPGHLFACADLTELMQSVQVPRPLVMLAPAGEAVDSLIETLAPVLQAGDILIDAGNSDFRDTQRRTVEAQARGHAFLGIGISGGAEGARHGPAIMAGGSSGVWDRVSPIFDKIAAKHNAAPCAAWFGPDGAGHFIKTAHNGIEYAVMQMIAECYGILRDGLGMTAQDIGKVFASWNTGALSCYLVDITAKALAMTDADTGQPMVDVIRDRAGQKGTGLWTAVEAQRLGMPVTTVEAALSARALSARSEQRATLQAIFGAAPRRIEDEGLNAQVMLRDALIAGKIIAYSQGFALIDAASKANDWNVDLSAVAKIWRSGCIIRSELLDRMAAALSGAAKSLDLPPLLGSKMFSDMLKQTETSLRASVATSAVYGLPAPALGAALTWFDMARTGRGTANLIQAQRDFFGAHGFERMDRDGTGFHGDWTT